MTDIIDVTAPIEQEGTKAVVKSWYVEIGQSVSEGAPLVELETDKVAVEVPAPASGILSAILIEADGEAEPGAVLGKLDKSAADAPAQNRKPAEPKQAAPAADDHPCPPLSKSTVREHRLSPAVRRLVQEHQLAPDAMTGTGKDGRLTRGDVQRFLHLHGGGAPAASRTAAAKPPTRTRKGERVDTDMGAAERVPHDSMRRRIAEHMTHSVQTAPHVTAVFEADFSAVAAHRRAHKDAYGARGVNLTYTAYMIAACVAAMRVAPAVNSRWHDDYLDIFEDINIGVGVALGEKGLIVPVVRQAQALSLFGIAETLHQLTEKARKGGLAPADVRGGTFSISNHGTSGSLVASPIIINQPQSAILGVGKLEKRVVVKTVDGVDSIQIRPMAYVSLTIDHRVIDGAQTNAWLTKFVDTLESWPAT